jgi:hypothetical protein
MFARLVSTTLTLTLFGAVFASSPAEARRLHWWQELLAPRDSFYEDVPDYADEQDADQFNQEQYDLYLRQLHRKARPRYNQSYYDPQVDQPARPRKLHKSKKKVVQRAPAAIKSALVSKPVIKKQRASVQTTSIGKRFETAAPAKGVDCSKGASIVSGYGFAGVTTKSCSGNTLVYNATRSGKPFEIQVNAANGELTAVKKL